MRKILTAVLLSAASMIVQAHELTSALGSSVQVFAKGDSTIVEYCPDNTCEAFTLAGVSASTPLQDFAFVYLFAVSDYIYLDSFQSNESAPSVRTVLARYRNKCPQQSPRAAALCTVILLAKRHAIRASFIRYDEGVRNVVPISLTGYRNGT